MFALAFDLTVSLAAQHHPSGRATNAYADIRKALEARGFQWTQGSLYILDNEDMSILFQAIQDLIALQWFPQCVRDIRAFRVEQWSNFTGVVTGGQRAGSPGPSSRGGSGGRP